MIFLKSNLLRQLQDSNSPGIKYFILNVLNTMSCVSLLYLINSQFRDFNSAPLLPAVITN